MDTQTYNEIINELQELNRPDFEIEEVGYFLNELIILKKEKMPMDNITEEIDKFQRIVINNEINEEDEEELFEEMNRKQMKKEDLLSYLKQDSFFSEEEIDLTSQNIDIFLEINTKNTLSEYDLYKYNEEEYQNALEQEKKEINYTSFDYAEYLKDKIKKYD